METKHDQVHWIVEDFCLWYETCEDFEKNQSHSEPVAGVRKDSMDDLLTWQ